MTPTKNPPVTAGEQETGEGETCTDIVPRAMKHLCGQLVNVQWFDSHGEILLYLEDPETGKQIERCPECGEEIFQSTLYPLNFFPEVYRELAERI